MTSSKETTSQGSSSSNTNGKTAKDQAKAKPPTIIRKYANRRLYHTGTSTYITLEDLAEMVRKGEDFIVQDDKAKKDITRSVLGQIIMEAENRTGQGLLPAAFLRQLIPLYGDSMQNIVPKYLEFAIEALMREQQSLREKMTQAVTQTVSHTVQQAMTKTPFGENPFGAVAFKALEETAKSNMSIFSQAFEMFNPLKALEQKSNETQPSVDVEQSSLDDLKKQIADMQLRLDTLKK
jgi:polyhydroxyalkanoate synthesis repressor PhaR